VQNIANMIVNKKLSDVILLDFQTLLNATKTDVPVVYKPVSSLSDSNQAYLKDLVDKGVPSCQSSTRSLPPCSRWSCIAIFALVYSTEYCTGNTVLNCTFV
jgi:hypothetical protein